MVFMDDSDSPKTLHEGQRLLGCKDNISLVEMADELSDDFSVGVRGEFNVVGLKHLAERSVIFNDAVMDDSNSKMLVKLRVGVFFRRFSVGGPAGMRNR